jgi:predicted DNA binding CopG/RHH family protein
MNFRKAVVQFSLLAILGAAMPAVAQGKAKQAHGDQQAITDVAGRTHKRTARVTHSQRKAVALRMQQARTAKVKSHANATGVTK